MMPCVHVTELQRIVLEALEEEKSSFRNGIVRKTGLENGTVVGILRSLSKKGLISRKWHLGAFLYSRTDLDYEAEASDGDVERVMKFIRECKSVTRNHVAMTLGFNWKKTVKLLQILKEQGYVSEISCSNFKIYTPTRDH